MIVQNKLLKIDNNYVVYIFYRVKIGIVMIMVGIDKVTLIN